MCSQIKFLSPLTKLVRLSLLLSTKYMMNAGQSCKISQVVLGITDPLTAKVNFSQIMP
jgi:hypothetical protein